MNHDSEPLRDIRIASIVGSELSEFEQALQQRGAQPICCSSTTDRRAADPAVANFGNQLITGEIDAVVFVTGAAIQWLRDGLGIKLWMRAGFHFGIITARTSHIVKVRASELGLEIVRQGFEDKLTIAREIIQDLELEMDQVCFIGDDLTDIPVIKSVGLGVAVADAAEEVKETAVHVTKLGGGQGAVRELVETILKSKNRWADVIQRYVK